MANKKISSFPVVPPLPTDRLPVARPVAGPNPFINEAVEVQGVVDLAQAYTNPQYPGIATVNDALDQILYITPVVTSFSNDVGTVETGAVVNNVNLAWGYNKTVVSQGITPTPGSLSPTLRALALTGLGLTSDTTFTLTGSDGTHSASATTSVSFRNKRFWGPSTTVTPANGAFIDTLGGSEFATSRNQTKTFDCTGGKYIYFAWPATFGTPSFTVNGFPVSGWVKTTVAYTNAHGHTENYDIYRSQFIQAGSGIVVVVN